MNLIANYIEESDKVDRIFSHPQFVADTYANFKSSVLATMGDQYNFKYAETDDSWILFTVAGSAVLSYSIGKGYPEEAAFLAEKINTDSYHPLWQQTLIDNRIPILINVLAHAHTHEPGGSDEINMPLPPTFQKFIEVDQVNGVDNVL